jgi:hypothetical protein
MPFKFRKFAQFYDRHNGIHCYNGKKVTKNLSYRVYLITTKISQVNITQCYLKHKIQKRGREKGGERGRKWEKLKKKKN